MIELDSLKKQVRSLGKMLREIRESLDDGDCQEYDILDRAEPLIKEMNRSLRDLGKTLDKHQEV